MKNQNNMKCEIAQDLMTLYVEDMCSEVVKQELEAHLERCPECKAKMEQLREELTLSNENTVSKKESEKDYSKENEAMLAPMKKVKKRLARRKVAAILLGLVVVILLGGIGVLSYGQMTNRIISFSAIADRIRVKSICEKLVEGDTQALVDVVAFRMKDAYQVRENASVWEGFEKYKVSIKESMDEAYQYHFAGKDIKVKIEEVSLVPYDENIGDDMPTTMITVGFYENGNQIHVMNFGKITPKKYDVYEYMESDIPYFTTNLLPYDDTILDICMTYATRNLYNDLMAGEKVDRYGAGLGMGIRKWENTEGNQEFKDGLYLRLENLYTGGLYIKDVMYAPDTFDEAENKWIYKVWFQMEKQDNKELIILEQRFHYYDSHLYVIEGEEPTVIGGESELTQETKTQILELFR